MSNYCEWKRIAGTEVSGMYLISCGNVELLEGTPRECCSCPYCGNPIKVTVEQASG